MPCYTERKITVELKAADEKLLILGLESKGFVVTRVSAGHLRISRHGSTGSIRNGQIELNERQKAWVNEIKQAYSVQVVKAVSKRFAWQLAEQEDNTFLAQRRFK